MPDELKPDEDLDVIQEIIGECGQMQIRVFIAFCLLSFPLGWHTMAMVFLMPHIDFICVSPEGVDKCSQHCKKYSYDNTTFKTTIISEWDLVCSKSHLQSLSQAIFMTGILLGAGVFGTFADKFGRRWPVNAAITIMIVFGISASFARSYWSFCLLRFMISLGVGGSMIIGSVNLMEYVHVSKRELATVGGQIPFYVGHLTLPLISYYIPNWRSYNLTISLLSLISVVHVVLVPESPRFLLTAGKVDETVKLLTKIAKINKLPIDKIQEKVELEFDKRFHHHGEVSTPMDLIRGSNMRWKTIFIGTNWFSCGLVFYGIAHYTCNIAGNVFANVALGATLEIPAVLLCLILTKFWGRRNTLVLSQILCSVCMFIMFFLTFGNGRAVHWSIVFFASIGNGAMSMGFSDIYMYSSELFPTVMRNTGVGISSMIGHVASIISPFIVTQREDIPWMPPLIFCIIPLIAGIFALMLPETKGYILPETIQEGEIIRKKSVK